MNLYCNYARAHWTHPDEHPPVGLILCTQQDEALARYALDGLHNKMLVREYLTALPAESELAREVNRARGVLVRQAEVAPDGARKIDDPASVCGRRAGKVERRRREASSESQPERNARRRAADGSPPLMRHMHDCRS